LDALVENVLYTKVAWAADVVIVGAGHNGLTAACFLARAGLSISVLEASDSVGGMTATASIFPKAPDHRVNTGALDATFIHATDVVDALDLRRHGYREAWVDPMWLYLHPGDASIALWRDAARTAEEMRKFSRADARAYLELTNTLEALLDIATPMMTAHPTRPGLKPLSQMLAAALRRRRDLREVARLTSSSAAELIGGRFSHPVSRGALASVCAAFGPIIGDATAVVLLAFGWYLRNGVSRPLGGTQAYPDALVGSLNQAGGSVMCDARVAEILVDGGRATGVRLVDGRVVRARRAVLATCDPRTALIDLLPGGALDPAMTARAAAIPSFGDGIAPLRVDMALAGHVGLDRYIRRRADGLDLRIPGIFVGTLDDAVAAETSAAAGRLPEVINLYAAIPTGADPTQAPDGQDTLWIYAAPMPLRPYQGWPELKPHATDAVIERAAQFIDGIAELEIDRACETPDEMASRVNATHGCLWHVDLSVWRMGPFRPARGLSGYRTPIANYYLGGAGSHPMPGMSSLPGRLASEQILKDHPTTGAR
jgi:phytoene dehydrogenase-like protein